MRKDIKNLTLDELRSFCAAHDLPRYQGDQVFRWLYQKRVEDFAQMTDIAKPARIFFADNFCFSQLALAKLQVSSDGTQKFLFNLEDGHAIETVFIPEAHRSTLCVSSQVGCRFSCSFCASGTCKFVRNLTVGEIINQYLAVSAKVKPVEISNIVFMGIGEPLDNFNNVVSAMRVFMDRRGLSVAKGKVSLSTCGLVPQIKELADLRLGIKLSISLHAAHDALRDSLMPINKKYPLRQLIGAAKYFARAEYPVTFEYVLLHENTTMHEAAALTKLLKGFPCKINLIPYNTGSVSDESRAAIEAFPQALKANGLFFTLRKSRGQDIDAACGQLRVHYSKIKC
jgi:23S rRNA (adenine2503-C2)-methyltransferase